MRTGVRHILDAALWLAIYLVLVLAPPAAILFESSAAGLGFWWDFSIALGFAGTTMMAVQFVLTARFRRATAPYGIDIIYYFHRYLAVCAAFVVLAHPLILILINPSLLGYLNPLEAPFHITAGVASVLALVLLVGSSLWRKPLRIGYDGWRLVHMLVAVAAVVLAVIHIDGVGYYSAADGRRPLWLAFVTGWFAIVVYVRLIKPWRVAAKPYRVSKVTPERADAWTLTLEPRGHAGLAFEPGQFVWLTLRHSPFAMKDHPFSISSNPVPDGAIEVTIKALGDFTRTIGEVTVGETAYVDGPYGAFSIDRHPAPGYVLIGGGIGLAPLMSMLRTLANRQDRRPVLLICANSEWDRVPFREAIAALSGRLDLKVVHFLERPPADWAGERGYITAEALARHLPSARAECEYFVCGPQPMIAAVEHALQQVGVPLRRAHSELFDLV